MTGGSGPNIEALTILLSATSTIHDEFERTRLIATGIPSLLQCQASGLALHGENWTVFVNGPEGPLAGQFETITDSELDHISSRTHARGPITILQSDAQSRSVLSSLFNRLRIQSLSVFPALSLAGRLGLLFVGREGQAQLSREESLVCQTLAEALALGIENLRLTQNLERLVDERTNELRHAEARQRALLTINNALVQNLNRDSLFGAISESLMDVVQFDRASLTFLDAETRVIEVNALKTSLEPTDVLTVGYEFPLGGSCLESVFSEKRMRARPDLHEGELIGEETDLLELGIPSYVSVPLFTRADAFGCLSVASRAPDAYLPEDIDVIGEVGVQVALAVENMLAFEKIDQLKGQLEQENVYLREEIANEFNFHEIIGNDRSLKDKLRRVEQVAPTDATVLICGETGTGKELFARAIHNSSLRQDRPLVKVNCAAISAGLVESELFGHEKGAFTGALQQRIGRFELADGGTLFLDEVGELPLDTQVKLLRVLQEGEFERVGGNQAISVDVRIIAATNRDLHAAVEAGDFRSDLFFRLNVLPVEVPSLRERKSDIPLLVDYLIDSLSKKLGKPLKGVAKKSVDRLIRYSWPGNIRELENVIERSAITSPGPVVEVDDLILADTDTTTSPVSGVSSLEEVERNHILAALERSNWAIAGANGAAAQLDINPNTLRSRMKKLGIRRTASTG